MKEEKKNGGDGLLQPRDAKEDKTEEDDEKKEKHGRSQTKQKVKKTKPSEPLRIPRNYQTVFHFNRTETYYCLSVHV